MEEITAEYEVQSLLPEAELRTRIKVSVAAKTDLGRVRENNEDKHEFFFPDTDSQLALKGGVFIVCDGMGGHEAGQIASELATKTFLDVYLNHPSVDTETALRASVLAANRFVMDVARAVQSRKGMGTTLSALVLLQDTGYIAQVGDSRIYRLREGAIEQLTVDHTWVEDMVRGGVMSRETAETHPNRHMLTRAIGAENGGDADIFTFSLRERDVYMICSDGLTNHVGDDELARILDENGPSEAAWKLVGAALVGGGSDNTTCIVVRVDGLVSV